MLTKNVIYMTDSNSNSSNNQGSSSSQSTNKPIVNIVASKPPRLITNGLDKSPQTKNK